MTIDIYFYGLAAMLVLAFLTWLLSLYKDDVSIIDSIWSLMLLAAGSIYLYAAPAMDSRNVLILCLLTTWSLRLAVYLTMRNWGEPEDQRYQQIRQKYQPNFQLKSLGIIFVFQALLAWLVSLSLWPSLAQNAALSWFDAIAVALILVGLFYEVVSDWQLARFKAKPQNKGKVLDSGLWQHTRHPNYFGECLIWWGFYSFALSVDAWWAIISPLLMTWLLLRFSGVVMLEDGIEHRRPAYRDYVSRTNAFIPGPVKPGRIAGSHKEVI